MVALLKLEIAVALLFGLLMLLILIVHLILRRRGFVKGAYVRFHSGDFALILKLGLFFAYVKMNGELVKLCNLYLLLFSNVVNGFRI